MSTERESTPDKVLRQSRMEGIGKVTRSLVFLILRMTGLPFLLREFYQRNKVTILCYHDPLPEIAAAHFKELTRRYSVISLRQYLESRRRSDDTKLINKGLVITLDDGHKGNLGLKHEFARQNITATIFLCSGIVGTMRHYWWTVQHEGLDIFALKQLDDAKRMAVLATLGFEDEMDYPDRQALSESELEQLAEHVDFQSHTRFHPMLSRCDDKRAWAEIHGAKEELQQLFGLQIYAFAYPNGDYTDRDVELVRSAGYECAVTIDGGSNDSSIDLYRLRRVRINDDADINELMVKASGLWDLILTLLGRRHGPGQKAVG